MGAQGKTDNKKCQNLSLTVISWGRELTNIPGGENDWHGIVNDPILLPVSFQILFTGGLPEMPLHTPIFYDLSGERCREASLMSGSATL